MTEMPNITSNAAAYIIKQALDRTMKSVDYLNKDIDEALVQLTRMIEDRASNQVHIESLKDALAKCQKQ